MQASFWHFSVSKFYVITLILCLPQGLDKDDISHKIASFCNKLPDVKPSITTWRQSSGQLVTWKPHDSLQGTKSSQECQMTWAEYQQNKKLVSLEHELQYKVYFNSQEKPCGDPNSYEELAKCRYLREFKKRRNLPEKWNREGVGVET